MENCNNIVKHIENDIALSTESRIITYKSMGIRTEKATAMHLLLENAYESNLIADISTVDYAKDNLGTTDLQPLEGLPPFVDDIYIFGYLRETDIVQTKKNISLSTGDSGNAKVVVHHIQSCVLQTLGKRHVSIINTVRTKFKGKIYTTISRIEKETNHKVLDSWKKIWVEETPYAYIIAKVDVSEMDIEDLHNELVNLERILLSAGYGIYCIDYTQDFSGTLVRTNLVQHLQTKYNMNVQKDISQDTTTTTIEDNVDSVGNNVLSWISGEHGYTIRTKIYNKIVSNFEAGKVQQSFGGHLADYVECSNEHLGKTFNHRDVQARGCTRIEISIYAYRGGIDFARRLIHDSWR
jgi:hypothetical protein